jgi:energy-converting hydrogenase A subunit E
MPEGTGVTTELYTPEFVIGLLVLIVGMIAVAYPRPKDYLTRLINLEIPGWGLLLVMLHYNEALALFTFAAVSVLSTYIFVRVMQKKEGI